MNEAPEDLKNVVCPQCKKSFRLIWNDYTSMPDTRFEYYQQTLKLRGCPSGGIYGVSIACPHCDYEEEL